MYSKVDFVNRTMELEKTDYLNGFKFAEETFKSDENNIFALKNYVYYLVSPQNEQPQYELAVNLIKKAFAIYSGSLRLHLLLAEVYEFADEPLLAKEVYEDILAIDPLYSDALNGLIRIMTETYLTFDKNDIFDLVLNSIDADHLSYHGYFNLGKYYERSGKYAEAVDAYGKSLAIARGTFSPIAMIETRLSQAIKTLNKQG